MDTTDVVIAGAGPTGLMLACELRLAGIEVTVVDRLPARTGESRAGGIHARTMEIFDQRGMLDPLIARGRRIASGHFAGLPLDFTDLDTRYPFTLAVLQSVIEEELDIRAVAAGASIRWNAPVTGIRQDADGVDVEIGGARTIRAAYLVGCDGGRGAVRTLTGIDFAGTDATMTGMIADVELSHPPEGPVFGRRRGAGDYSIIQFEPGWYRLMLQRYDRALDRGAAPDFEDFRARFVEIADSDPGMHSPRWVTQFGDAARHAERYRHGRVFVAGDAAHIHFPAGGQGLNLGVQDAVNLGWKLAAAVRGRAPEGLLDSYESERYPVAARVLHNTRAQTALSRPGPHTDALRDMVASFLDTDEVRRRLASMITALDIRYETGGAHPSTGYRVPDADLRVGGTDTRVHVLLRTGRSILLCHKWIPDIAGWEDRVDVIETHDRAGIRSATGSGGVGTPAAVLVRPDGYVAWAGDGPGTGGLTEALTRWFGPAA
ncbi:FAD-dependent monooxygenase [Nocardia aurea]|uniref:FAD-dependent monooxygenase n=1 Tax=Nocardia aurea TaxID=2144174 RepID=UPI0033A8664C